MKIQLAATPFVIGCVLWTISGSVTTAAENDFAVRLRYQEQSQAESGRYHRLTRDENWVAKETAFIVCDVWDLHHCLNAVRREKELAPRLNQVLTEARRRGATIIHAPSSCMDAYTDHPARKRVTATPTAKELPDEIQSWCSRIPAEERGEYPIDQSDGGEDDDPKEHAEWAAKLKAMGRNPKAPWKSQYDVIEIDEQRDYISDRGEEVWSILEEKGIKNVVLTGVHTNMCVLGRPFGLRQMSRNGKNVVLMRDMTDTMYNPARWPYVSHFTGTDLIVSHIEKFVCPTITSDQVIGGREFRFSGDKRPHVVVIMAEDEYKTNDTLPRFAVSHLGKDFRVSLVFGSEKERHLIPGIEVLKDADVALFSVRRRWLPTDAMKLVRDYVAAGKPVVGIRTASHAFEVRNQKAPSGFSDWPAFDAEVFGGNYHGHHGNSLKSQVSVVPENAGHAIFQRFKPSEFAQGGSLYKTSPLAEGTIEVLRGKAEGQPAEPIAWTYRRADKGRSFYTSLGHVKDFENEQFLGFIRAAIQWAANLPVQEAADSPNNATSQASPADPAWSLVRLPMIETESQLLSSSPARAALWLRSAVRLPSAWVKDHVLVELPAGNDRTQLWFNGHAAKPLAKSESAGSSRRSWRIDAQWIEHDDANLVVLRCAAGESKTLSKSPVVMSGGKQLELSGRWQFRLGDDPSWSNMPLPAKFGASTDIVFQP